MAIVTTTATVCTRRSSSTVWTTTTDDGRRRDYVLRETLEWGSHPQVARRKLSLTDSRMDVDSVDASYSLDSTSTTEDDSGGWLPPAIAGRLWGDNNGGDDDDTTLTCIEHCLATSDNSRARCFVFYDGSQDQQLARIVVCHEERVLKDDRVFSTTTRSDNNDNS